MYHRSFLLMLAVSVLVLGACKKSQEGSPGAGGPPFKITGVHDLTLQPKLGADSLHLHVSGLNATDSVEIAIEGLPPHISYRLSQKAGQPDFSTVLYLDCAGIPAAGVYTLKVIGTSSVDTQSYQMKLTVPGINGVYLTPVMVPVQGGGFRLSDSARLYTTTASFRDSGGIMKIALSAYGGDTLVFAPTASFVWPVSDGTYEIRSAEYNGSQNNFPGLSSRFVILGCASLGPGTLYLTIAGGKRTIRGEALMYTPSYMRTMHVAVSE